MQRLEHPCKFCGKPAIAEFEDHAPQEAVDKWLPMLVHNHCADMRIKKRNAEESIVSLCLRLIREKLEPEKVGRIRIALRLLTKRYAEALAAIHQAPTVIWSEAFGDLLADRPKEFGIILWNYREEVRRKSNQPA